MARLFVTFSTSVCSTRPQDTSSRPLGRHQYEDLRSGTPQNAASRPEVHHTDLVVRTRYAGPSSMFPSKWPAAAALQERLIKKWLGVKPSASVGSMSTSVNGLELTMCLASIMWKTSSRGLLFLNVADNAVFRW
ncbi:hypothetical protein EVAR_93308_1 [Eumeta japonica]|uniref:Uncharacterized protein n=1 Tax=Eumeta variegata TaxID=151549 RepID=A0A4C1USS1_EUMVA|nr:hypothetical protein EVAR_93308_1 [Eumeta japonica]